MRGSCFNCAMAQKKTVRRKVCLSKKLLRTLFLTYYVHNICIVRVRGGGTGYHFLPCTWLGNERHGTIVVLSYLVFSSRSSDRRPRSTHRKIRPIIRQHRIAHIHGDVLRLRQEQSLHIIQSKPSFLRNSRMRAANLLWLIARPHPLGDCIARLILRS